jgi:hypothetical protein
VSLPGLVSDISFHGASTRVELHVGEQRMHADLSQHQLDGQHLPALGASVQVCWPAAAMVNLAA